MWSKWACEMAKECIMDHTWFASLPALKLGDAGPILRLIGQGAGVESAGEPDSGSSSTV